MGLSEREQGERVDTASRIILATPRVIFRTFLDAETLGAWRIPEGVVGRVTELQPRSGGGYCMTLVYGDERYGISAPGRDVIDGRFVEFLPDERVAEDVRFVTMDGGAAGMMTFETLIEPAQSGTKVSLRATGMPGAIGADEHREALAASLRRLALLTE